MQMSYINCQDDAETVDTADTAGSDTTDTETSGTDTSGTTDTGTGDTDTSGTTDTETADSSASTDTGTDTVDSSGTETDSASETDASDGTDTVSASETDASDGTDTVATDDASASSSDAASGTDDAASGTTDAESTDDTESAVVVDDTPADPDVGTKVEISMEGSSGLNAVIYFEQMESGLVMHCEVSTTAGTDAALEWPDEFPVETDTSSSSDDTSSGTSDDSATSTVDGDASVLTADDTDTTNTDTSSSDGTETASGSDTEAAETPSVDTSETADSGNADSSAATDDATDAGTDTTDTDTSGTTDTESTDDSTADTAATETDTASDTDDTAASSVERTVFRAVGDRASGSCGSDMPQLYIIKDNTCCTDPSQAQCASVEGKKLGCLESTGTVEHTFTDLSYYEVEEYCLAITNKEATSAARSGQLDSPKFVAAGPQSFRAFGLYNFNNVNFLSSGTKTITSSASTGAISINYPSSSSSSSGGSTSVGFFDTLPYIRLEGLTADYLNVLIVILMLFYGLSIFSSYLNLQPLIDQFTAPFSRMGDFAAEKMDVLADRVRTSIKNYNRRYTNRNYHNNVRRVDYDLNYGYDDDDYYYYVR